MNKNFNIVEYLNKLRAYRQHFRFMKDLAENAVTYVRTYISHTQSFHLGVSTMQLSGSICDFCFTGQVFGSVVQKFTDCCMHNSF